MSDNRRCVDFGCHSTVLLAMQDELADKAERIRELEAEVQRLTNAAKWGL